VAALLALPAAGFLNACYIIVMGGDYIHARLFMAPFFAACIPVAVVPMARRYVVSLVVIPWALVCSLTLRTPDSSPWTSPLFTTVTGNSSLAPKHPLLGPDGNDPNWYPARGVYVQFADPNSITYLDAAPATGLRTPVIATSWIGYEPYELGTGVQILDLFGLADPLTAHLLLTHRGEISGHEKPLPTPWVAALLTAPGSSTAQLDKLQHERPQVFTVITPTVTGHQLAVQTAWARAALACPTIADLVRSPSTPLTVGGFLSNMVQAVSRTELRIPANPEVAYHQFCGPGTPSQVRAVERSS
jgi:arabinofuranosyltransferase